MKPHPFILCAATALAITASLGGCGHKEGDGHNHAHSHGEDGDGHGHDHAGESPSGASFKEGKGVMITDETRKILGLTVAGVEQRTLVHRVPLTLQVFDQRHHHARDAEDHAGCDVHGAGFLSTNAAALVRPGHGVEVSKGGDRLLGGVVLAVQKALALGEAEVIIGVSNAATVLKPGEFVPARIHLPGDHPVTAIPESALLRTAEGTFVYTVNGGAYLRTAVKAGAEGGGWIEILDGLLEGDLVVTQPVQSLWLIELRATKGGGHSH